MIHKIPGADAFCIALVMLLLCVPLLPLSERLRPVVIPVIAPIVASTKIQERVALRWSCGEVRAYAAGKSKEQLEQDARRLTAKERAEAVACLKKERKT